MYKAAAVIVITTGNRGHARVRCLPVLSKASLEPPWEAGSYLDYTVRSPFSCSLLSTAAVVLLSPPLSSNPTPL